MSALVVSLNPAVDAEWRLPCIVPEEKNELVSERRWPGGKGVNVARWLRWLGSAGRLFLPLGGDTGNELARGLRLEGLQFTRFPLREPTRVNVVVTPDPGRGPQYRFNPTWPRVTRREAVELRQRALRLLELQRRRGQPNRDAGFLVLSGTLAFGAPVDTYARLVRGARRAGHRTVVDCDREPFALAVHERPWLVKPNEFELAQWAGKSLRTEATQLRASRALAEATGGWVLVSRGAEGAWLINLRERRSPGIGWSATPESVTPRNRVGAGDALLAGAIAAAERSVDPIEWLRSAVATGTAATQVPPGETPTQALWKRFHRSTRVAPLR